MKPPRILPAFVVATASALVPVAAHAVPGEILYRTAAGSVGPGTIANNSASTWATFQTDSGWWLYRDGQTTMLAEGFLDNYRVWTTLEGHGVWHDDQGVLWRDDGSGAQRLIGPGDPCPDGAGGTVQYLGANVSKGYGPYAIVDCFGRPQIHNLAGDGIPTPIAIEGTALPGYDGAAGTATLQALFDSVAWTVSPGDVVFSAQVDGCEPDPACPGGVGTGTFRLGFANEAIYVAGADAPGLPPEYRGSVLGHVRTNVAGDVAFMHESFGAPPPAVFVRRTDGLYREVAIVGEAAPGTGTTFATLGLVDPGTALKHFEIDEDGHASFSAIVSGDQFATLWEETDAGVRRVIWPGMELPGAPGSSVVQIEQVVRSPSGRLAAIVQNGAGSLPSQVVVAQDLEGELAVVWHRDLPINDEMFDGQAAFAVDAFGTHGGALSFTDYGQLAMAINASDEAIAVVIDTDTDSAQGDTDIGIDFILHAEAPIYWGQRLDFDAVLSNFDASPITSYTVTIGLPSDVTDPQVECPSFEFDATTSTLTPRCEDPDAPLSLPNGRDIPFSLQTPTRAEDGDLVLTGMLQTSHEDGRVGSMSVEWTMPLLATPDGTDLEVSVDDVDAATSFVVRNVGLRPATAVVARATLDAGAGHFTVPDDPRCQREGESLLLVCNVGDLAPGGAVTIDFPALSDGTGTLAVESASPDPNPDNDSVRFTLLIEVDPDEVPAGCGACTSGRTPGAGWWLLGLLAVARRRRRFR